MKSFLQILFFFLLVTQICFAQWVQVGLNDKSIKDIAAQNSSIFIITADSGKLFRSTDNGINWSTIVEWGAIDVDISPTVDVFMLKDSIYNSIPKQLFISTDVGSSWTYLNVMEQIPHVYPIQGPNNVRVNPSGTIFCGYDALEPHGGYTNIARSTDNGLSWTAVGGGGLVYDFRGNSVLTQGAYNGTTTSTPLSLALSNDEGLHWSSLGIPPGSGGFVATLKLCLNGIILAGVYWEGLFLSDDSCSSWIQKSTVPSRCGLSLEAGGMLVGTEGLGVFLFSDDGDSLGSRNEGLANLNVQALTLDNNDYVYAGTGNGVWRRPLSEVTPVEENQIEIPSSYFLSQNFPNPFNPSTTFRYSIPQTSKVVIKVYDILGNEIATLMDEEKPIGTYEVTWYAEQLPSGVYFYQLKAGDFIETKKMLLLK